MQFSVDDIKAFIVRHYQYFIVGILFICLVIILSVFSGKRKDEKAVAGNDTQTTVSEDGAIPVPDVPLETDAYPEVDQLVSKYFTAMAAGDTATLTQICSELDEKEQIRIEKKSEYSENYGNYTCYTKPGPETGSYIVFAYYEIKFKNIDTLAPGLTSLYVKTADDGSLYVYDGSLSTQVSDYIRAIAAQDDVVELLNRVDAKYNEAAASDETLKNFMEALPTALDDAVSAELAAREAASSEVSSNEAEGSDGGSKEAKVKETVNVRKSASTEGDKLGKLMGGDTVTVYETMDNGWSKIDYQGEEAYVKTEFLLIEGADAQGEDTAAENNDNQEQAADNGGDSVTGKVTAKETVRIRKSASTDGEQLGSAYEGDTFDLIMEQADGWCKIKYKGQTAYIKTEFVTVKKN